MKKTSDKSPRRTGAQLKAAIRRQPAVFAVYTILRLIVLATLVSSILRGEYESAFICLLVLVLFSTPLNGCRRWISFGGFTVQVSEIAKFEMILLTAHLAAKAPRLEKLDPGSNRRVPPSVWLYQRLVRELIVPLLPLLLVLALLVVIVISDKLKKDKPVLSPAEKKAANRQLWLGGLCCGAALAMASNFQQAGMVAGTDSGKAGFLTALYVVLVPVCGLFFKRKVSLPVWIAVALSVIALYLLCINGEFSLAPGDLLILACAVCFTIHILVIDHFTATVDGVKLSCLQFLFAALISTVCMFLFEDVDFAAIWSCILPLLYVGIFSCGVGYTLQILAQKGSNPTVVTILLSLESVFAVIAGAVVLHQQMTAREYLGCVLMFAAVILAQIPMPQKKKAKAE